MSRLQLKAIDWVDTWPDWLVRAIQSEWTTRFTYWLVGLGWGIVVQAWVMS